MLAFRGGVFANHKELRDWDIFLKDQFLDIGERNVNLISFFHSRYVWSYYSIKLLVRDYLIIFRSKSLDHSFKLYKISVRKKD